MREGFPGVADIDLPREKMERLGPEALRNEELLAVLLRTGYEGKNVLEIASEILVKRSPEELMKMGLAELTRIKGIGRAKAAGMMAAFEFSRRGLGKGIGIAPTITSPADLVPIVSDIKDRRKEYFVAVFLNARNQVICREDVSRAKMIASMIPLIKP